MKSLKQDNIINFISRIRVPAGWFFFILVACIGKFEKTWPVILILIGEAFRTIAAGTIIKNEKLATEGVYNIVRHPLYLGSFCIALGLCFICNEILIWIYFLIFFPATYIAAIKIEEKWLKTKFKDSFEEYKKNIPAFVPLKIRKFQKKGMFSWKLAFKNKEHHNWLILAVVLIILILKSR
ncbi:MAG TPA: isoprenylcysteine carboxylmethyltransferase family protein [Candidatus Ratteibacteria bacterium]|uniref:Ergosterol biosynthesis ERG4/ERG24 family protein n=1 Tax=candidate division TA06 bacterium ADurb.Bin131 TaxID=1852827 RepID=A0A1V6C526_UNCT6|nr:MAG: Ergosterol biosynthesis ERG4/ERG24 family protein [candidate division TA06 bacterium ADurb.Bin131]HOC03145.1 isoprenylcysteine carboxylmethyltransferase family protein [bacterium]HRS06318.1 isoprenylcysteine carboxylmethyltransferase family protein [Candidatus Ratteibacteria bacterium]HON05709.1 isoprenylcysteine carboxylmethyltransferase family protein [bacterium]HPC29691.1 isoprenylcysteine carboxylmethyltransferase family protein [bacterium]